MTKRREKRLSLLALTAVKVMSLFPVVCLNLPGFQRGTWHWVALEVRILSLCISESEKAWMWGKKKGKHQELNHKDKHHATVSFTEHWLCASALSPVCSFPQLILSGRLMFSPLYKWENRGTELKASAHASISGRMAELAFDHGEGESRDRVHGGGLSWRWEVWGDEIGEKDPQ